MVMKLEVRIKTGLGNRGSFLYKGSSDLNYSKPTFIDLIQKHSPLYLTWNRQKDIKRKDTEAYFFIHHEK